MNDTLGHAAGDQLLQEVSGRIASVCRASDICSRLGGDEFAVAIIQSSLKDSLQFANRLVELISRPYLLGEHQAEVSVSIGVSHFPNDATDVDTLLRKADHAMYRAKAAGKGRVCTAA